MNMDKVRAKFSHNATQTDGAQKNVLARLISQFIGWDPGITQALEKIGFEGWIAPLISGAGDIGNARLHVLAELQFNREPPDQGLDTARG
jgi:hypothetical protein